jgi:hypothetical protein
VALTAPDFAEATARHAAIFPLGRWKQTGQQRRLPTGEIAIRRLAPRLAAACSALRGIKVCR